VSRHESAQVRLQVLYLGRSANVGALRRSLEAHGAITRSRLTPEVDAVITDTGVAADHPTLHAAAALGIPVLGPYEAIDQLVGWRGSRDTGEAEHSSGAPVIAGSIAVLVLLLAAIGILGSALGGDDSGNHIRVNGSTHAPQIVAE